MEPVIGLEIHVQLKTQTKMFCGCLNLSEEAPPNSAICSVCTGQPGALPVVNAKSLAFGLKTAVALGCEINETVRFDRKNYFYPDLPKGYQITQYRLPVGLEGALEYYFAEAVRTARIERVHLEEDAAKLLHQGGATLIDFNRAGTPLMEVVTAPDFSSPEQARAFLDELKLTLRVLGVSDADMEKGQLRVDANVSLRPRGESTLHPKTEIKNLNSFRGLERALKSDLDRQRQLWERGEPPASTTTRGWDEADGRTVERREKEAAHDYRYFPEPDLPPVTYDPAEVARLRKGGVELPMARRRRFTEQYGFSLSDANQLIQDRRLANFAEEVVSEFKSWVEAEKPRDRGVTWHLHKQEIAKLIANWLVHRLVPLALTMRQPVPGRVTAENFAEFLTYVFGNEINATAAQQVLEAMVRYGADPSHVIDERGLRLVQDADALTAVVERVLAAHPKVAAEYRHGKTAVLKFLIGKVMQETKGTADPQVVTDIIVHRLK